MIEPRPKICISRSAPIAPPFPMRLRIGPEVAWLIRVLHRPGHQRGGDHAGEADNAEARKLRQAAREHLRAADRNLADD